MKNTPYRKGRYAPVSGLLNPIPVYFRNGFIIRDSIKHCNSFFSLYLIFSVTYIVVVYSIIRYRVD